MWVSLLNTYFLLVKKANVTAKIHEIVVESPVFSQFTMCMVLNSAVGSIWNASETTVVRPPMRMYIHTDSWSYHSFCSGFGKWSMIQ